ncbi:MAG: polysaccharide deacetylase family protein [Erysipelotrichaceae bacterium]|nr:polysaccharide deacetylase family protein [Erysipelotrichaceae bacterium]
MGKRFDTLLFPGHKAKAFTLSYDDGVVQDKRLIEIFDRYNAKCTFNLNYGVLGHKQIIKGPDQKEVDISKFDKEEVKEIYKNHEVGGHGLYHSSLISIGTPYAMHEIIEDKVNLEKLIDKQVKMFAYPFGHYNEKVVSLLKDAGYKGARTVESTHSFDIPKDFLILNPTCHHNDPELMKLAKDFVEKPIFIPSLFYLWGHGYEFDHDGNYDVIENLLKFLHEYKDTIWFATNSEIIEYVNAYRNLEYSGDGSMIYNPSAIDVEILTSFKTSEIIKAGETIKVKETEL